MDSANTEFSGGCACGEVRYVCSQEPVISFVCHCRDCQRASGSAFTATLSVPARAVRLARGAPTYYITTGASGGKVHRGFCAACGSPVMAKLSSYPDIVCITAASLDDPGRYQPGLHLFVSSALPWDHLDAALPRYAKGLGSTT